MVSTKSATQPTPATIDLCPRRGSRLGTASVRRFYCSRRSSPSIRPRRDAPHHRLDLAAVSGPERVLALHLGDVGHPPPLHPKRVLALAPHAAMMAPGHGVSRSATTPRA